MKFLRNILIVISVIGLFLIACNKDNNNDDDDNQPVTYTVTYSFEFPHGDFKDFVLKYMDKEQQMQTVDVQSFPWTITLTDFQKGDSAILEVKFTALPSPQIDFSGKVDYTSGSGSLGISNCGQVITGLTEEVPLQCNAALKIGE